MVTFFIDIQLYLFTLSNTNHITACDFCRKHIKAGGFDAIGLYEQDVCSVSVGLIFDSLAFWT